MNEPEPKDKPSETRVAIHYGVNKSGELAIHSLIAEPEAHERPTCSHDWMDFPK